VRLRGATGSGRRWQPLDDTIASKRHSDREDAYDQAYADGVHHEHRDSRGDALRAKRARRHGQERGDSAESEAIAYATPQSTIDTVPRLALLRARSMTISWLNRRTYSAGGPTDPRDTTGHTS
jgi:hypothetical protein